MLLSDASVPEDVKKRLMNVHGTRKSRRQEVSSVVDLYWDLVKKLEQRDNSRAVRANALIQIDAVETVKMAQVWIVKMVLE